MPATSHATVPIEQPILWLGMSGFTAQQRAVLEASLTRPGGSPRWRTCTFGEADAWWVNGANVSLGADGNLRVAPGMATEQGLKLNLSEVDRPIAFATPLADDDFEPRFKFDPVSEPSIQGVLLHFETWLWLTRAEFVLGAQIVNRGAELRQGVYQVSRAGRLLAVLDFQQGRGAILPRVHPVDLWEAQWDRRPIGAHDLPESFHQATPAQMAWAYVRRTDRDLLPTRYRVETIFYKRVPAVPMRWLRDSQLMLLRELSSEPTNLDGLRQSTGMPIAHITHDLACLYYAGSITTTRSKAAIRPAARHDSQPQTSGPDLDSLLRHDADFHGAHDPTAPAQLEHRRALYEDSN